MVFQTQWRVSGITALLQAVLTTQPAASQGPLPFSYRNRLILLSHENIRSQSWCPPEVHMICTATNIQDFRIWDTPAHPQELHRLREECLHCTVVMLVVVRYENQNIHDGSCAAFALLTVVEGNNWMNSDQVLHPVCGADLLEIELKKSIRTSVIRYSSVLPSHLCCYRYACTRAGRHFSLTIVSPEGASRSWIHSCSQAPSALKSSGCCCCSTLYLQCLFLTQISHVYNDFPSQGWRTTKH